MLLLGALLFALSSAWLAARFAPAADTSNVVSCQQDVPHPEAPADRPLGSEPGVEDDEDGDSNSAADVAEQAVALRPPLSPAGALATAAWSYEGFVSEPSTPPPRG
jgi:hypothetical protein